ncbi:MAG: MbnP family protein [Bacteroidia bacterium]
MKKLLYITIAALIFVNVGCKPDEEPEPEIEVSELNLTIDHQFDSVDIDFLFDFVLPSNEPVIFRRLSYILGGFYLVNEDGTKQYLKDQYGLIDVRGQKESVKLENIPMGNYKAIGFSIGLDSAVNHGNPNFYDTDHPLSPINNSLHWSWQGGYIFTAVEGKTKSDDESFVFHLAGSQNKIDFEFPIDFTKGYPALNADLTYNVAEIFRNPNLYNIAIDGSSTHNVEDETTKRLIANMVDVLTLNSVHE